MVKTVFKAAVISLALVSLGSCGEAKKPKKQLKSTYVAKKKSRASIADAISDAKPVGEVTTETEGANTPEVNETVTAVETVASDKKRHEETAVSEAKKTEATQKYPSEKPVKVNKPKSNKIKKAPKKRAKKKYSSPAIVKDTYVAERNGIKLYQATLGTEFQDASLSLHNFPAKEGRNKFSFYVKDYDLKAQTNDAKSKSCSNSGKGQHMHFIVNNGSYKAKYEDTFTESLEDGSNVILAFLSRSYHESIKSESAYVLKEVTTDGSVGTFDEDGSHMFYSRPKGNYSGRNAKRILLDFYLVNTVLSEDGYKVKATVNGEVFMITQWMPIFMEGLPMGENTVRLQLVDANGNQVPGRFNDSGLRKIVLSN
mgnify:CR=1 FL=1